MKDALPRIKSYEAGVPCRGGCLPAVGSAWSDGRDATELDRLAAQGVGDQQQPAELHLMDGEMIGVVRPEGPFDLSQVREVAILKW